MNILEDAECLSERLIDAISASNDEQHAERLTNLLKNLNVAKNASLELNSARHREYLLPQIIKLIEAELGDSDGHV